MKPARSFASDNNASIHPAVLRAIAKANQGHTPGYGDDRWTESAIRHFRQLFGQDCEPFVVFNGTAANCLALKCLTNSYEAIICSEGAHINTDECGAPERFTGCKLLPVPAPNGKLTVEAVAQVYHGIGDQHHVQPRVISITQSTEVGAVYQPEEVRALAEFAHQRQMFLHMDGARIANAAVSLGLGLRQITRDLGVDALSFGGTKNGGMGAEAVILFPQKDRHASGSGKKLGHDFLFLRKQGMQLASKMRFISAQLDALLSNNLWRKNAAHANRMAKLLEQELRKIPQVKIVYPVEANGVFAKVPRRSIPKIQERYFFYVWNEEESIVRWMCSFDTTERDVKQFVRFVEKCMAG